NRVQKRLGEMIESRHAQVTGPAQWPDVLGYAPWVEQVWMNYLSNALKYGEQPPEIAMGSTLLEDDMVRLWIRNKGIMVPVELQKELFKPFTRLHNGQEEGHGLGLSIVRRIVEKLGGEVGITNEDGYGPVFSFTLRALKTTEGSEPETSETDTATVSTHQGTRA
ncbi:MAG TPA: HAMP domain-containing sensor histidine kinase, partial [Aggregatilineales bacterium]|nr:HAMP domain-containing sensor histidine kinase [Aggregatilineales bacterium]